MNFVLVTKDKNCHGRQGNRLTLVSYAQLPLFKTYEELLRQADTPAKLSFAEGKRVLNKYANSKTWELLPYDEFEKEFKDYIATK